MCSSSSSFPLFLNPPIHHKPRPLFPSATFSSSSRSLDFKSFLCFSSDPSQFDRREVLWLREEQRWLREEQRWLREEQRWARERDSLLRRIANLERRIQAMQGSEAVAGVAALVQALKDQSRIAESGTSASPIVLEEKKSAEDEEREKEMVVVEKVVRVSDGEAAKTTGKKKRSALRMGSEGEEVRAMQEALEKLGFYSGEEDIEYSSFSTGTERAVKTWQASLGAREDGIVSEELLERLFMEQTQGVSSNKNAEPKVAVLVDKLPSFWKEFKSYLMHKRKEMTVEQLVVRLPIEEDNRRTEKKFSNVIASSAKANVVERDNSKKKEKPGSKLRLKGGIVKKKLQGKYFNCNKVGHKSADCRLSKRNKDKEANVVNTISKEVSDISLSVVVSEVNLVDSNSNEWWLDTVVTRHICCDRVEFANVVSLETGEKLFMGNSATSVIKGQVTVFLKMTSGKEVKLSQRAICDAQHARLQDGV